MKIAFFIVVSVLFLLSKQNHGAIEAAKLKCVHFCVADNASYLNILKHVQLHGRGAVPQAGRSFYFL